MALQKMETFPVAAAVHFIRYSLICSAFSTHWTCTRNTYGAYVQLRLSIYIYYRIIGAYFDSDYYS